MGLTRSVDERGREVAAIECDARAHSLCLGSLRGDDDVARALRHHSCAHELGWSGVGQDLWVCLNCTRLVAPAALGDALEAALRVCAAVATIARKDGA